MPAFAARVGGENPLGRDATPLIEVPADVVSALGGGARPQVVVTVNGHTYRSTLAVYGGRHYLPSNQANRAAAGIGLGDEVLVTLERDDRPRVVELPGELEAAFRREPALRAAFERGSYTKRKEHADWIRAAKQAATRERRLLRLLETLR